MLLPSARIAAFFRALLGESASGGAPGARAFDRAIHAICAAICLFYCGTLRDVGPVRRADRTSLAASPPPSDAGVVRVRVTDAEGMPLERAIVRVFAIADSGAVSLAGERDVKGEEVAEIAGVPRGEAWVVAYARDRARGSARLELSGGTTELVLALGPAGRLEARVLDEAGNAVPGARVAVHDEGALPHVAEADAFGSASFDRLGRGPWHVSASAEGFETARRTRAANDAQEPIELRLVRLGGFALSVVEPDGSPAAFAEVFVSGPRLWPARTATTDANGEVLVTGLSAGVYDLRARLGDRVSRTEVSVPLARGQVLEQVLALEEGRFVSVRVVEGPAVEGREAAPVREADVLLVEGGISSFPVEGRTNDDGLVVLGPIGPEGGSVRARASGFVPRLARLDPTTGDDDATDALTIALLRGGSIVGDVRDERGDPIVGATIEVLGTDPDGMPIHETSERADFSGDLFDFSLSGPVPLVPRGELGVVPGPVPPIPRGGLGVGASSPVVADASEPWTSERGGAFRVAPVSPGRVQLLVRHPDYIEALSDVLTLEPGAEIETHVVLGRGARLEGRVVEADRTAVEGALVELAALAGTFEERTYTLSDGSFAVGSVPREVLVTVSRPDSPGELATRISLSLDPNETTVIEIVLPKARAPAELTVTDARGAPLERVEARVLSLEPEASLARTLFSDGEGRVVVPGAEGLPLRVVLERPGFASTVALLEPARPEQTLVLASARTLRGRVTRRQGRDGVEGAAVTLFTDAGARHATTNERGEFEVGDLAEGRIRVLVRKAGFANTERVVGFEGDERRPIEIAPIELVSAGAVEGVVTDEEGRPVAGARVGYGGVPTYLPQGRLPPGLAQTDDEGRFVLGDVPEGSVELEAYSPTLGRGRVADVAIRAGRTTDRVTIVIPAQDYDPRKLRGAGSVAVTLAERSGSVVVLDVPEGGEAEHGGLEPDDRIVRIGKARPSTLEAARDALGGPLSEDVIVEVERPQPRGPARRLVLRLRREIVRR